MGDAEPQGTPDYGDRQVRWDDAERLANLDAWVWDAAAGVLTWSPEMYRLIGGEALVRHGVPAELLLVEVAQSGVMERLDAARVALERISALGVRILIDDFGTGYSSIARLRELPVVGVKVDRAFTKGLGEESSVGCVLAAIRTSPTPWS